MACAALRILRRLNPRAIVAFDEDGTVIAVEDVRVDEKWYRVMYRSTPDGEKASGFCMHNPWSTTKADVQAGHSYEEGHVSSTGFLCLSTGIVSHKLEDSPFGLEFAIQRTRYWCVGFSYLMEHDEFPQL